MAEYDEQIVFEMGYNKGFSDGIKGSVPKSVLEDIKAEIQQEYLATGYREDYWKAIDNVLHIIDKHISGEEQQGENT